ncbi:WhiB family transcriptional regulator [Streptomyces sp. NPDC002328]|uniref:WhiB family transcriptional regulator n=1 Tax=Streptomyces sp. NPDC002328 TaxID=3364642 RepID=UPI00369CBF91
MGNYTGSVPDTAARRYDWMERAICRDERKIFDAPARDHEARTICVARCPVRSQCLAYTKASERGLHRDQRDSVAAGLTHSERHRLDPESFHRQGDSAPITFTGGERCGTHFALLRHLWLDEPIDSKCWSGEVMRERDNAGRARTPGGQDDQPPAPAKPAQQPAVQAPKPPRVKGGTPHERRVYRLWAEACTDLEIARRMGVSVLEVRRVRERLGLLPHDRMATAS